MKNYKHLCFKDINSDSAVEILDKDLIKFVSTNDFGLFEVTIAKFDRLSTSNVDADNSWLSFFNQDFIICKILISPKDADELLECFEEKKQSIRFQQRPPGISL